jgi:hypothetical protein
MVEDGELGLQPYELSSREWAIVEQLCDILKVSHNALTLQRCHAQTMSQILKDATTFFSHSTPNLATVIPVMDHIDNTFTTQATS